MCCSADPAQVCVGEGDGVVTRWELTEFGSLQGSEVRVNVPCTNEEFVTGVR